MIKKSWLLGSITAILVISILYIYLARTSPFGISFWLPVFTAVTSILTFVGLLTYFGWRKSKRKWLRTLSGIGCLMSLILFLVFINFFIRRAWIPGVEQSINREKWITDIDQLTNLIRTNYPGFNQRDTVNLTLQANKLKDQLHTLENWQVKSELLKVMALLNDGHSVILPFQFQLDFHFYPLNVYQFDDGLYIIDADQRISDCIGTKIIEIESIPTQRVMEKLEKYVGGENNQFKKTWLPVYGMIAELLANEGIAKDRDKITITCQTPLGVIRKFEVRAQPFQTWGAWYLGFTKPVEQDPSPVKSSVRRENYSVQYRNDKEILYVQLNQLENKQEKTIKALAEEIKKTITEKRVKKVVIDLRNNLGGNNYLARTLVNTLRDIPEINRKGHLFILIGRKTYSAAVNLCSVFENMTNAIFIGEATGAGANHYGDPISYRLPNSNIQVQLSSKQWLGSMEGDTTNQILPDITIHDTFTSYLKQKDSVLNTALNFSNEPSNPIPIPHQWAGRYLLTPYLIATIDVTQEDASLIVSDFTKSSLFEVHTSLSFVKPDSLQTNIRGVSLTQRNDSVFLSWKQKEHYLNPVTDNFYPPMYWIARGETDGISKKIESDLSNLPPHAEVAINTIGYRFLSKNETKKALDVFILNTQLYPNSANAFDSLGEAYVAMGDKQNAIKCFNKALELNPTLTTSKANLKRLGA